VNGTIPIKKFWFCQNDLRVDDGQGFALSDTAAIVTSNNVTLEEKSISMLEPVQGLVCFVKGGGIEDFQSVLIYNPSTRVKTPWIETSTSAVFRNLDIVTLVKGNIDDETINEYMFGFGIDPATNQHKVLCIYRTLTCRNQDIISRGLFCGVFTVGENTWRKIDQVPPNIVISGNSVHVRGSIYWMSSGKKMRSQDGVITVFDLGSETFRFVTIPNFILDLWSSTETIKLVHELVEVDGHLTILVGEGDDMLSLWIYSFDKYNSDTGVNWIQETMQLPCRWDNIHNIAFKAITGTSLVVIKVSREVHDKEKFHCEYLQYYDRKEKKHYRNQFMILWEPTGIKDVTYSITPFFETLLPV
ncbi:hypothetical protein MKW92_002568, partial [Papaver armeniacum]